MRLIKANYDRWSANVGIYTPWGSVCAQNKEIDSQVSEICSRNEMRTYGRRAGRANGNPRRRQYPPLKFRWAADKKSPQNASKVANATQIMFFHTFFLICRYGVSSVRFRFQIAWSVMIGSYWPVILSGIEGYTGYVHMYVSLTSIWLTTEPIPELPGPVTITSTCGTW